jgi:hypothetical protein
MAEPRPDPMTELVRILREQLHHKDERITALERLLEEANHRIDEQQRLMVRLLERSFDRSWATPDAVVGGLIPPVLLSGSGPEDQLAAHLANEPQDRVDAAAHDESAHLEVAIEPSRAQSPPEAEAGVESVTPIATVLREGHAEHIVLPDLGPQIDIIAGAVVAAAARRPVPHEAAEASSSAHPVSEREALSGSLQEYVALRDEYQITLKLDRQQLRKGHRALEKAKRGFLPWRRNREA